MIYCLECVNYPKLKFNKIDDNNITTIINKSSLYDVSMFLHEYKFNNEDILYVDIERNAYKLLFENIKINCKIIQVDVWTSIYREYREFVKINSKLSFSYFLLLKNKGVE